MDQVDSRSVMMCKVCLLVCTLFPRPGPSRFSFMTTLDRYIARQYLVNIVSLLVLLCSFVVTIDVALNLNRYAGVLKKSPGAETLSLLGRAVRTGDLVVDLWWPRLLQLFVFLLGMVLVGAMGFTVSQLVRHRELVAMMAGGVSLRRAARPILIVAAGMTVLQAINQELVIPRIAPLLTRDHGDAGNHDMRGFEIPLTDDGHGRRFYAQRFDPETRSLEGVVVWELNAEGLMNRSTRANAATWDATEQGWRLERPTAFEYTQENPETVVPGSEPGRVVPPVASVLIPTPLDPTAMTLRQHANFSHSLSWRELTRLLRVPALDPALHDKLVRIKYGRVSMIISNFLTLLIVMPFFITREPRNMVLQSLKCAPVGIGSLMGSVLGASAALPGVPPGLAVFLPVVVLTPIAIASMGWMRT